MSLKIKKSIIRLIPKIIFYLVILALSIIIIRLALWEKNYYESKEGTTRATVGIVGDIAEINTESDPVPITEEQRTSYKVLSNYPRYLTIEKLGIINARVLPMGENSKGQIQTPYNISDAGWYQESALPGTGKTAIIVGHNGGPNAQGIFKKINNLTSGDIITIEMGDGKKYNYRVYENYAVSLQDASKKMHLLQQSPVRGTESISLISCTGEYSLSQKTYLSRQFLRATRTN